MSESSDAKPFMTAPAPAWPFRPGRSGSDLPRLYISRFDFERYADDDWDRAGLTLPEKLERAVPKRRAEYLAGRCCARRALAEFGCGDAPLSTLADRQPQWPTTHVGSITHSRNLAAAVVGARRHWAGLGLDAEQWLGIERAERLASAVLTESERSLLAVLDPAQRARHITLTFSLKESLYKALYPLTGTRFYFHDAAVLASRNSHVVFDATAGSCQLRLLKTLSSDWPAGRCLQGDFSLLHDQPITLVMVPSGSSW